MNKLKTIILADGSRLLLFVLLIFANATLFAQIRLPHLISNGMILQRDAEVKIWGWSSANESIQIAFLESTYNITADENGKWKLMLSPMSSGGPYTMELTASNTIIIEDILIGDVWICSGQSNMELSMRRVSWIYEKEIEGAENDKIRQFYVPRTYNFNEPQDALPAGEWKKADKENIYDFSAVAYFFGKELFDTYSVPIGLINTALGGSPAEAWMSKEALKEFPEHLREAQKFKNPELIAKIENSDRERSVQWHKLLKQKDRGSRDAQDIWNEPDVESEVWQTIQIPGYWNSNTKAAENGSAWFRKKVNVPAKMVGESAMLLLGRIVDADSVFVNGVFVGATSYQYPPRRYKLPPGILKAGENTIVVRVINHRNKGGFVPDKPYEIVTAADTLNLKGEWEYKVGAIMDPLAEQTFIRWKPTGLFNAMIAPLLEYKIKGVIWYQGESNEKRPYEYRELLPAMITDWRTHWQQGDFPFIYVQLANYMEEKSYPQESNWAILRESQLKTLSVPNTAMAVTIDIGEWNDIHPLNKKDVGKRLAIAAQNVAYDARDLISSGPIYRSHKIKKGKIMISFMETGSGLAIKGGEALKYFSIAGADKNFVWANAEIRNDKVVVWSDKVQKPVAVRYAWADNPEGANLYNLEGLPASPFRTDDWNTETGEQ